MNIFYLLFIGCIQQSKQKTDSEYLAECYNALYASAYSGTNYEYLILLQKSKRKTLQHHCMTPSQAAYIMKKNK
jgi:hypothetical protein